MQQSFEESVKGGPEEAAKLLAAAIVGERSRTSAGVSAERDAEARGGRHAAYRDLIAPSVISMRAIPKHLFVSSGMQAHRYHLTTILCLRGPRLKRRSMAAKAESGYLSPEVRSRNLAGVTVLPCCSSTPDRCCALCGATCAGCCWRYARTGAGDSSTKES